MQMPWYYGWNVIGLSMIFQAISFGAVFYSFAVMAIPLTTAFDLSLSQVMLATVFLQVGLGLLSPLLGRALDLFRLRNLVVLGALALSLGFFILAHTHSVWVMMLVYGSLLPTGLILAGTVAAQTAATRWFVRKRGLALGVSAVGTSIGAFLFPPLVEHLISRFGLSVTFQVVAAVSALVIIPLAWIVLRRDPDAADIEAESQAQGAAPAAATNDHDWTTPEVLRQLPFWIIIAGFAPVCASFTAIQFNLGAYARDIGLASAQAAYLLSITAVAMVAGKFFFASLADRLDYRLLYWILAAGQGIVLVGLQFSPGYPGLVALILVFGFSMGGALPMLAAIIAHQFGVKAFGRLIGICTLFVTASSAAGPYFTALIYDATGSFGTAFTLILGLLLTGAVVMAFLKPEPAQARLAPAQP